MRTQRVKWSISSFITFGGRSASGSSFDTGYPGFYRSSIQKPTIPLVHRLLVLIPKAVAWLRCYHALQERVPKRWALSCHYLTNPFYINIGPWQDPMQMGIKVKGTTCDTSGYRWYVNKPSTLTPNWDSTIGRY